MAKLKAHKGAVSGELCSSPRAAELLLEELRGVGTIISPSPWHVGDPSEGE